MSFECIVPGKWILAGEHSVLRGCPALVFPLKSRFLSLHYRAQRNLPLQVELAGEHGDELQLLFWGVIEKACALKKIKRADLTGALNLKNTIPIGAGLGASAALCVALTRWFQYLKWVDESEVYEFSRSLENLFHGESSGVDIAVALSGEGIRFVRGGERKVVRPKWRPKLYVSYSGRRGVTLECVNKVKALIEKDPELGAQIDENMKMAVDMAERSLSLDQAQGLPLLQQSMRLAEQCFERWDLCVEPHIQWLRESGAIAVKPTGSGGGGFVLSLWDKEPSVEVQKRLIPCL